MTGLLHCREKQECRGRSPLPEREVSSLLFLFSPPQAEKSKNATALLSMNKVVVLTAWMQ
jgi:hypothetical protein